jgi:hypothetical protein
LTLSRAGARPGLPSSTTADERRERADVTSPATVSIDLDDEGIPDFTPPPGPRFRVYEEVYEGVREIAADTILGVLANIQNMEGSKPEDQVQTIKDIMTTVLVAESAERFVANMSNSAAPIGLKTLMTTLNWMIEQYGGRPTEPDSDSSPGSENPESGTSSTATTSAEVSTSSDYRQIDSST